MIFSQLTRVLLGAVVVSIGILGLLVPIMPGWVFIIPGLVLISPEKGKRIGNKLKLKISSVSTYFN
jgi:uncharacterized membrane protein YbaN (DUF454 family)